MARELRILQEALTEQLLTEGERQVYKKYADTGKLPRKIVDMLYSVLRTRATPDKKFIDTYFDWFVYEFHRSYTLNPKKYDFDVLSRGGTFNDTYVRSMAKAAQFHSFLVQRKVVKGMLEYSKSKKEINWVNVVKDILHQYAVKKKTTGVGGNYIQVYNKDGFEIFACIDQEAVSKIGAAANWCIRRDEHYWNDYNAQGQRFYVIVDHHRGTKLPRGVDDAFRKVCIQHDGESITIWGYDDSNMHLDEYLSAVRDFVSDDIVARLEEFISTSLEVFDSEYDDEDEKLREEVAVEYDALEEEMYNWQSEFEERMIVFDEDVKLLLSNMIKETQTERDEGNGDNEALDKKIAELKNLFKNKEWEDFYEKYIGPYRGAVSAYMTWYPTPGDTLEEWWRDAGVTEYQSANAIDAFVNDNNESPFGELPDPRN